MNKHTHTQYTSVLCGNPNREKTMECFFLYVLKNYIHWKHQLPLFSSCNWKEAPTPYFLKLQPKGRSNSPILWLQLEGGYNPLCSSATTGRWLQLLELLHTHLGFIFPKFIPCLLVIISHYPVSYNLGENIPPREYSLSVDTSV
jgi:hypothetical protein